jgi:hypothetical protein
VIDRGETLRVRHARRMPCGRVVVAALCWIALAATAALAQQSGGTVTETVTTRGKPDVNGREAMSEKVVTHRARTSDEERVVIETYSPSMAAGRLALSQRVERVTTVTDDGSQTVEETAEPNPVAPADPMRIVQRSLTTVRRSGNGSFVIEQQVFERDGNGRLVLVRKQTSQTSRD